MPIVDARSGPVAELRGEILHWLARRRQADPSLRVLDVGGGANTWADSQVDAYADINPFETSKQLFTGDICEPEIWEEIRSAGRRFDFSICTHVLEDVRDPLFVARRLREVSRAGFISMPTKHSEMSNVESVFYPGYCHHRWIYTVRPVAGEPVLVGLAKLPVVGYLNSARRPLLKLLHALGRWEWIAKAERRLGVFPGGSGVDWVDPSRVGHQQELGFRWQEGFRFELVNGDYAGDSCLELADLYRHVLREGL